MWNNFGSVHFFEPQVASRHPSRWSGGQPRIGHSWPARGPGVAHWQKLWSNNPQERLNRLRSVAAEPAPERGRGGHLPQPAVGAAPGVGARFPLAEQKEIRRNTGQSYRTMLSRRPPKPGIAATSPSPTPPATRHCRRPMCAWAVMLDAAGERLININEDDALLHYLTGHYRSVLHDRGGASMALASTRMSSRRSRCR